ncbi:MAG: prephenate dehydrogenase/arogenate dehydrogenase family protein [Candidatus Bathyarchaeota archaeon]|nr:prephenate dehydrogenase/arogenate dehydrogenase family protein [Candidatus Bathyarchaeota archaeon]
MHAIIIGIDGGMGQWMKKHLENLGCTVGGFDERRGDNSSTLNQADLVVVSVPIQVTAETIRKTVKHLRPGACLMEIASLKSGIHEAITEASELGLDVLCVHPMWGPSTCDLKDKTVAVIPLVDVEYEKEKTLELFPSARLEVVEAGEHDRLMSLVLSLPYLVNLAIAATIQDEDLERLRRVSGSTYSLQYVLAQSVSLEKTCLVEGLLSQNIYMKETTERFLNNIRKLINSVEGNGFQDLHEKIVKSMTSDPTSKEAHVLRQTVFETIKKTSLN